MFLEHGFMTFWIFWLVILDTGLFLVWLLIRIRSSLRARPKKPKAQKQEIQDYQEEVFEEEEER